MTSAIPISDFGQDQPITDVHIASFINFLFRSSVKRGRPLQLPRRGVQDDEPDSDANISHAPLPGVTGFRRYRIVLDALVGVCVSNAHQCLALSVTFGDTSILATFAENQTKPPASIEKHLRSVWEQLRALSRLQQSVRKGNDFIDIPGDSGISPKAAEKLLQPEDSAGQELQVLKDKLYLEINKYCYMKTRQRYKKYLGGFAAFYEFYREHWRVHDPDQSLMYTAFCMSKIHNFLQTNSEALNSTNWSELTMHSCALDSVYTPIGDNLEPRIRSIMAVWAKHPGVQGLYHTDNS